ncbi:hypothetical protein LTR84_003474 [Exophiala bonariae]|uniref:YCII-related domain-containing protein n=1 Tax=Exophiala bonariae TaxID=1690606 RepID=A0AAV9N6Z5_9EURO|nr:hypothetical protein LTR84_003474 [Exophiala bonariae]
MPRYIYLLHANDESELGASTPAEMSEMLAKMGAYNQSLKDAGLFITADGFRASKEGARVTFSANSTNVQNGPFNREGLIRGYWIVKARDLDEAVAWAKKAPLEDTTIEVRRFGELEDFKDILAGQSDK